MLDNLYENIGDKIKNWAKWMFIVEAIGAIISGFVLMGIDEDLSLYGLLALVCGPIVALVSSWTLFAFGQLVEDVRTIRDKEGTTEEVKFKREAELKAQQEADEKARREDEEDAQREVDDNFIYIQCNNCRKEFSYQKGMRNVRCPWCNAKQN